MLMKICKFINGELIPVKALMVSIKGKEHYNIKHGTRLKDGWEVSIGVDDNIMREHLKKSASIVTLEDSEYILLPIMNHDKTDHVKDGNGNIKYFISVNNSNRNQELLLFINLPSIGENIDYKLLGNCRIISMAKDVIYGDSETKVLDAPIVLMENTSSVKITYDTCKGSVVEEIQFVNGNLTTNSKYIELNKVEG
jgi:hypothetical protein